MEEWGETKIFLNIWLIVLLSVAYSYLLVSRFPPGKLRLLALLPIFYLFITLPLSLSAPLLAGTSGFLFTWLANLKLLLFAFNLGPLSSSVVSLSEFILVSSLPIKITKSVRNHHPPSQEIRRHHLVPPLNLRSKTLVLLVLSYLSGQNTHRVPAKSMLAIYCCTIYLLLDTGLGLCNKVAGSILGAELDPPFDEPYLSTSLTDFWGRRWNLMVNDTLRHAVYYPVGSFCIGRLSMGRTWARCTAVMSTFVVSGLFHEVIYYYMARAGPTWEVTCFFLLHGGCVILEDVVLKRGLGLIGKSVGMRWAVSGPVTIGFLMCSAFWLFFPQLVRNGVHVRSIEDVRALVLYVASLVLDIGNVLCMYVHDLTIYI